MHNYRNKLPVLIILAFMLGGWLISSCKKEDEGSYVNVFLAGREWQLASQQLSLYHGDTLKRTDTLNRECPQNQVFNFNSNGNCTYTNYSCIAQSVQGTWQITTQDSLLLRSNILLKDTSARGSSRPFAHAQIVNLGQNSLVLQSIVTDTLRRVPTTVLRRRITRYAFIH